MEVYQIKLEDYAGGDNITISTINSIDFVTIATLGNASDFGDLSNSNQGIEEISSSPTRGYLLVVGQSRIQYRIC